MKEPNRFLLIVQVRENVSRQVEKIRGDCATLFDGEAVLRPTDEARQESDNPPDGDLATGVRSFTHFFFSDCFFVLSAIATACLCG